tara:strand:+ start:4831 stop:5154 length:324 start_codon:yes stop_codon:yes gene_type:complete
MQKNLFTYLIIALIIIPVFGFNFLISLLGNILILLFLIPLLFLIILFLGINSFKSSIKQCANCGSTVIGNNVSCIYCGSNLDDSKNNNNLEVKASEETIEVEAEEIS